MKACDDIAELMSEQIDGRLDPAGRAVLREHLAQCARCRRDLESLQRTVEVVRGAERTRPPADLVARVRERVEAGRRWSFSLVLARPDVRLALAASVVLCVCLYSVVRLGHRPEASCVVAVPVARRAAPPVAAPQPAAAPGAPANKLADEVRPDPRREVASAAAEAPRDQAAGEYAFAQGRGVPEADSKDFGAAEAPAPSKAPMQEKAVGLARAAASSRAREEVVLRADSDAEREAGRDRGATGDRIWASPSPAAKPVPAVAAKSERDEPAAPEKVAAEGGAAGPKPSAARPELSVAEAPRNEAATAGIAASQVATAPSPVRSYTLRGVSESAVRAIIQEAGATPLQFKGLYGSRRLKDEAKKETAKRESPTTAPPSGSTDSLARVPGGAVVIRTRIPAAAFAKFQDRILDLAKEAKSASAPHAATAGGKAGEASAADGANAQGVQVEIILVPEGR